MKMLTQKMGRKTTGAENKVMARKGKKTNALRLGDSMAAGNRYIWNEGAENISACDNTQHIWNCPNVIQREVVRFKPDVPESSPEEKEFAEKAVQLDGILQEAYWEFLADNFNDASENYIKTYIIRKRNYENKVQDMHPSTAAGYVIESKVSSRIKDYEGLTLQNTSILSGTRPDIVLESEYKTGKMALLDITASKSVGHILLKKGNWLNHDKIVYVAELTYPSINFDSMTPVKLTAEQEELVRQHVVSLQNMRQEWQDYCRDNLIENQARIVAALKNSEISAKLASRRQKGDVIEKFNMFGITISFEGDKELIRYADVNLGMTIDDRYSSYDMNYKANTLIDYISSGKLIGMGAL